MSTQGIIILILIGSGIVFAIISQRNNRKNGGDNDTGSWSVKEDNNEQ